MPVLCLCEESNKTMDIRLCEDIAHAEDMLFFWQVMRRAKRMAYIPLFQYHYRMRDDSAVHSGLSEKRLTSFLAIETIYSSSEKEADRVRTAIKERYMDSVVGAGRDMVLLDFVQYKREIQKLQCYIRENIWDFCLKGCFTKRVRFGAMYFCLPYSVCVWGKNYRGQIYKLSFFHE